MALQRISRYFQMRFKNDLEVFAKYSFGCQRENKVYIGYLLGVAFKYKEFGYGLASTLTRNLV